MAKPPSVALKFLNAATWIVGGLLGAAAAGPWFPGFRSWVEAIYTDWFVSRLDAGATAVSVVGLAIAAYFTAAAVHELGHVVAGKLAGYRLRQLRVGLVVLSRPFRVSLWPSPGGFFTGHAILSAPATGPRAPAEIALALGGPLANLLTAFVLLATPGRLPLFSGYLLMFSLVLGLATLVPASTPSGNTDGRNVAIHFGGDPRGARRLALQRLRRDLEEGTADRSPPELFRAATAVRDASSDTVLAHMLAFGRAWQDGRRDEAGELLETALEFLPHAAESTREAVKSDAATWQAKHRRRTDLAEQWLAEVPDRPSRPWNRLRPEAAILAVKGDVAGASAKLEALERGLLQLPPGAIRDHAMRELGEWRAELAAC